MVRSYNSTATSTKLENMNEHTPLWIAQISICFFLDERREKDLGILSDPMNFVLLGTSFGARTV
ncbi:unnamed protein product [Arabidopsis thaliana]|uniref:Uncharacterized protein n=1 Tax=Arabidopsis thaliana TaxID=3702 RepID=A0A5S9WR20_ARATH|nr:unnamed protein product [Arabidopsis thaliana]